MKFLALFLVFPLFCDAQKASDSTLNSFQSQDVVVTATKTERKLSELSVPIMVISAKEIAATGSLRLDQLLAMQTGLAVTTDNSNGAHGKGIQIQGFDPDYILILVDGEPLIGRTAGTLDLSRITLNNIERIEILKGAASCLYGSEAMGGVINIITKRPPKALSNTSALRYGTFNRKDLSNELSYRNNRWYLYTFFNRYSTDGYNLNPNDSLGATTPRFYNYSGQVKAKFYGSANWQGSISGRFFNEHQFSSYRNNGAFYSDKTLTNEFSLAPILSFVPSGKTKLEYKGYSTVYRNDNTIAFQSDNSLYSGTYFLQQYTKSELQYDRALTRKVQLTTGVGGILESVEASRYQNRKTNNTNYGYFQTEEKLIRNFLLVTGLRYDHNSLYGQRLSPKLSTKYDLGALGSIKASYGTGFKAPDFRQLYLTFTNPVEGYSVFGVTEVASQMAALEAQNNLKATYIPASSIQPLKAEYSAAYNLGYSLSLFEKFSFDLNFFYNRVHNLIDTRVIATKTNNQSVYSYFNINQIYTRGVEVSTSYRLTKTLQLKGGYQFLDAKDIDVLKQIDAGKVLTRNSNGDEFYVRRNNYFGLPNRSRHSGNLSLNYQKNTWETSLRVIYKGRYGFADKDGNGIINKVSETVAPYYLVNASIIKKMLKGRLIAQLTLDNALNYKNPAYIPSLPGRTIMGGISYQFSALKKTIGNE